MDDALYETPTGLRLVVTVTASPFRSRGSSTWVAMVAVPVQELAVPAATVAVEGGVVKL
jgi:hypothetical protein